MKYLVTGGAGFIGSHLIDELLRLDHGVVVADDFSAGKWENLEKHNKNPMLRTEMVDISAPRSLDGIFDEPLDGVFHLAAVPRVQFSIANPDVAHRANVDGTHNVLDCCRKAGVKDIVFSSSSSVYGDQTEMPLKETMAPNPMSPYATHKLVGEIYCRMFMGNDYNLRPVMLRYFNVFGPRQDPSGDYACLIAKTIKRINEGKAPEIWGTGENTRDFTYVSDVVNANIQAMVRLNNGNNNIVGEAFNIGAGNNRSVNYVVDELLKISGSELKPYHISPKPEPKDTIADITKAKLFLNWAPQVSFEEGLRETYNFFKGSS
jgi:UDP-glucose 4-epimerase